MRKLEEIREEARRECLNDNCQSWAVVCLVAMEKALKEFRDELVDNLSDKF